MSRHVKCNVPSDKLILSGVKKKSGFEVLWCTHPTDPVNLNTHLVKVIVTHRVVITQSVTSQGGLIALNLTPDTSYCYLHYFLAGLFLDCHVEYYKIVWGDWSYLSHILLRYVQNACICRNSM